MSGFARFCTLLVNANVNEVSVRTVEVQDPGSIVLTCTTIAFLSDAVSIRADEV